MRESWLFKIVPFFIAVVFLLVASFWTVVGVLSFKGAKEIQENGLKSFISQIWEGNKSRTEPKGG